MSFELTDNHKFLPTTDLYASHYKTYFDANGFRQIGVAQVAAIFNIHHNHFEFNLPFCTDTKKKIVTINFIKLNSVYVKPILV